VVQEVVLRVITTAGLTAGLKVRPTVVQELVLRVITTAGLTAGLTARLTAGLTAGLTVGLTADRRWPASAAPVPQTRVLDHQTSCGKACVGELG
jgi:hypothetical protein